MQTVVVQNEQLKGTVSAKSRASGLIQQHPLASFFVLAYAISWILWLPLVIPEGDPPTGLGFVLVLVGSLVPSTLAIALIAVLHGKAGVRKLLRRLLMWRVGVGWWIAVVVLPTLALGAVGLSVLLGGDLTDARAHRGVLRRFRSSHPPAATPEDAGQDPDRQRPSPEGRGRAVASSPGKRTDARARLVTTAGSATTNVETVDTVRASGGEYQLVLCAIGLFGSRSIDAGSRVAPYVHSAHDAG